MVDLIGGALVLACVLLLGWTVFVRADDAAADLTHWRNLARQARHDIGALRTRRLEEQTRLEARQTELARSGPSARTVLRRSSTFRHCPRRRSH